MTSKRKFVQGLLILASLGFFLPFVTVSCQGMKVVALSGTQLLTGTRIGGGDLFQATVVPPNSILIIGFVCGIIAFGLGFKAVEKLVAILSTVASLVASVALVIFFLTAPDAIRKFTMQAFSLEMELGYWISVLSYAAAAVIAALDTAEIRRFTAPQSAQVSLPATSPPLIEQQSPPPTSAPVRFCPSCGSERIPGKAFCPSCGAALDSLSYAGQQSAPPPIAPLIVREPRKPLTKQQKIIIAVTTISVVAIGIFYQVYTTQKAKPIMVYIHSNMDGEKLFLDGVDYSLAPRSGPGGPVGMPNWEFETTRQPHTIRITHESAKPWEGTINPGAFEKKHMVEAMLVPQTYLVNFVTHPGGAKITYNQWNDLTTGGDGNLSTYLMSGSYSATVSHPGYPSIRTSFYVSPSNVNRVEFDLEAERGRQQSEQAANAANLVAQANQLFQQQRYDEALALCDSALQIDSTNAQAQELKKNIQQTKSILGVH